MELLKRWGGLKRGRKYDPFPSESVPHQLANTSSLKSDFAVPQDNQSKSHDYQPEDTTSRRNDDLAFVCSSELATVIESP
ncbi:hypothetical protein CDAR_503301 [Caerostris darwini]|uniref:Uncharacterized protein n=1 Tax=Caerostris darwini TaxID=1538125 RepID=A0AAV4V1M5_9ARAC|nr:hypothetical protein CDAR_503301 [Caerostris darwini]